MKRVSTAALSLFIAGAVALPVLADGHLDKAIKARKAQMTLLSWNLGKLGAMAKGEAEYNAEVATAAANSLVAVATVNTDGFWPAGTDSTAMPDKTRAKKAAWDTYPDVANKHKDMVAATQNLAAAAGNGLDALKEAVGATGKTCGGCHKPFREEQ